MPSDISFLAQTLEAAIEHARTHARGRYARRACAVFWLRCEQRDYIRRREYWHAHLCWRLLTLTERPGLLTSLLEALRNAASAVGEPCDVPMSNTGHTVCNRVHCSPRFRHMPLLPL